MSFKDWITEGTVLKTQDEAIWIKRWGTFDAFQWLGRCAKVDEGTENLGDISVTQRLNPRGGLERDSVLTGAPGEASTTLTIKRLQADKKKTDLRNCFWNVDQRTQCGGMDSDSWNKWDEIIRYCYGKATERGIPGTAYDGDNEEQVVTFPWKALWIDDIYRVQGEIATGIFEEDQMFLAVSSCQPARCPDICDDQEDCIVVAVTESNTDSTPFLGINLAGGDLDSWTQTAISEWGATDHPTDIACVGQFVVVTSNAGANVMYSDDLGTTQVHSANADMATYEPNCVDMLDQSFIVVGGDAGYIYASYDAARTWETLDAGNATTFAITDVMIARDNPLVIYAVSSADDVCIKTENGGRTWYAQATTGTGGGLLSLFVLNQSHVLVGTDNGELYETTDGGDTWTEQTELPGLTTKASTNIVDIKGCGCGSLGLVTNNSDDNESFFFRNVDSGADGKWFQPTEMETVASGYSYEEVACCGSSHFVAVGGDTTVGIIAMLAR